MRSGFYNFQIVLYCFLFLFTMSMGTVSSAEELRDDSLKTPIDVDSIQDAGITGILTDTVERHGRAIKEHLVYYEGVDRETGQVLKRSLKKVSESKVNPEFEQANIKQQAGFAAELKEVARRRATERIAGKSPQTIRTDDIAGHVNDQFYDITCSVDKNNNPIPGASAQMKFVGASAEDATNKLLSKDFEKYIKHDVQMVVPKDYYERIQSNLNEKIVSLERQIEYLSRDGSKAEIKKNQEAYLDKCRRLQKNLRASEVTNAEALQARLSPKLSTGIDIAKNAHRGGIEAAKVSAIVAGGASIIKNTVAVYNGEKTIGEATCDVAIDTGEIAVMGYVVGASSSAIKGWLLNAGSKTFRSVGKSNLPAFVAAVSIEVGQVFYLYYKGEINGVRCVELVGEKCLGVGNELVFATIGQAVIPIPVVGALVGSMVGYTMSTAAYNILLEAYKDASLAREERIRIERECRKMVALMISYKAEFQAYIDKYLINQKQFFDSIFNDIEKALAECDIDGYIGAMNRITYNEGETPLFQSMKEFDVLMQKEDVIRF